MIFISFRRSWSRGSIYGVLTIVLTTFA